MRDNHLKALQRRRYKRTTDSQHGGLVAPNLLDQDFSAPTPNRKWGTDISYGAPRPGWSGVRVSGMLKRKEELNERLALCCERA